MAFLLLMALSSWIGIPGVLNEGFVLLLSVILAVRIGRMAYFKRLDGSFSRRSQRLFRRWSSAIAVIIAVDAGAHLLFAESIESSTLKGVVELIIFWGLGSLLFFKWDLLLLKEPTFEPYDAMILHAAISAGERGISIGQLCRFSEAKYSPDTEEPSSDGVILGRICSPEDPMFYPKNYDSDVRDKAIGHSLWKLKQSGHLHPKGNEFQTFQMTPKGFADCAALIWEMPVIAGIGALHDHLKKEGPLD